MQKMILWNSKSVDGLFLNPFKFWLFIEEKEETAIDPVEVFAEEVDCNGNFVYSLLFFSLYSNTNDISEGLQIDEIDEAAEDVHIILLSKSLEE